MKRTLALLLILIGMLTTTVLATPVVLPQTGQTNCYDASGNSINCLNTLQDGKIRAGMAWPSPRFVDNQNGTVGDQLTNLVWTKNADAPESATCGYPLAMSWQQALDYVACLNTNNYLGVSGWTLPNVNQLQSLINYGQSDNVTWLTEIPGTKPGFTNVQNARYWTNDSYAADPSLAWSLAIGGAGHFSDDKINAENHVWPVRNAPDLIVTNVGAPTSAVTGQTITVPVTIKNIGTVMTPGIYFSLYLSTDSNITASDIYLSYQYVASLSPGAEGVRSISFVMPHMSSGTYYIGAIADSVGEVIESNESNNATAAAATTITYGPDLVVTNIGAPTSAVTGQTVTVPVTTKNIGTGTTPNNVYFHLFLSTDSNITASDYILGAQYVVTLAPGEERINNISFSMPQVWNGTYYIGAIVDFNGLVSEYNESNNAKAATATTVTYGPDLVVWNVEAPATAVTGQTVEVPVTIKNIGTGTSSSYTVDFALFLSTDSIITASDMLLSSHFVTTLAPGMEGVRNVSFVMPQVGSGTFYIGAIADSGGFIYESDENNNAKAANSPTQITQN